VIDVRDHDEMDRTESPVTVVRHTARWAAIAAMVVAAGLIAVLATRPPASVDEVQNPVVGRAAPPIAGQTLSGTRYVLPRAPGRFVVVSFFASWCEQCQSEGPELVKFQFEHQQAGDATMLSVMFSDSPEDARASQAQLGATWPTLEDSGGTIALDFGVHELPSTFVIAPDGRVAAYIVAPVTAADLDQVIAQAKVTHA
jgi:cytochrome c biogenesis protein CcmG, thiol:disulfide interchange protein DsbE